MKKNILLLFRNSLLWTCLYTVVFTASSTTLAYFSDSATSTNNLITATIPEEEGVVPITKIVINEVSSTGFQNDEWVEIYNAGNTPINLQNWKIRDNGAFDILTTVSTIILPQSFAIVVGSTFASTLPSEILSIRLSTAIGDGLAAADQLILEDSTGTTFDQFSYGTVTILPNFPQTPATGKSIIRFPNGADTDTSSDFSISNNPTFGTANQL